MANVLNVVLFVIVDEVIMNRKLATAQNDPTQDDFNVSLLDALKQTGVIEIDGIFIGKSWFLDTSESETSPDCYTFIGRYIDDETHESCEWYLKKEDLANAVYDSFREEWEVRVNGDSIIIKLFTLTPLVLSEDKAAKVNYS